MKKVFMIFLLASSAGATESVAQSTFRNLNFEAANVIFNDPPFNNHIDATNALPGWDAFSGTTQLSSIPFGAGGTFPPVILYSQTKGGSLEGLFSVVLSGGGSISQTALVPVDVRSLLFMVGTSYYGPFSVSLEGQDLAYTALSITPKYTLYGAEISSFGGQTATLDFKSLGGITMLDGIQFSSQPIPEPSAVALIFLAGGIFLRAFARRRGSSSLKGKD